MNFIQEHLTASEISIDIRNQYISGVELKALTCKDPVQANKFIEEIVTNYFYFQSEQLKSDLEKLQLIPKPKPKPEPTCLEMCCGKSKPVNDEEEDEPAPKKLSPQELEEKEATDFREFLDNQGKSTVYNFTWSQINILIKEQLSILEDPKYASQVFQLLQNYIGNIKLIKSTQGLSDKDLNDLKNIKLKNKISNNPLQGFKQLNIDKYFVNPSQKLLFDLEKEILPSRIEYCQFIKPKISSLIKEQIEKLPFINEESFRFAPVKGIDRSSAKLAEYQEQQMNQQNSSPSNKSALYQLDDILRCSIVTLYPSESAKVLDCIEKIPGFKVIGFYNGFDSKNPGSSGRSFDRYNQAEIRVILRVEGPNMRQEELVEVLIIQKVNIMFKKFEHKIYDFTNREKEILKKVSDNAFLAKQIKNLKISQDVNAAEQVRNSEVANLSFIKKQLADYYPFNQQEMLDIDQIFRSRQSWRNGKFDQMCNRLEVLNIAKGSFNNLRIIQDFNSKFDIEFKIDFQKLNQLQKEQIEKERSIILRDYNFSLKLSKQIGNWQVFKDNDFQYSCSLSKDGLNLQIASGKKVKNFCTKKGMVIKEQNHHSDDVNCVVLSQDGYLYSGSDDINIVKQKTTGEKVATFMNHSGFVLCLALSNDGQLYSGSSDKTIVKQKITGEKFATFRYHNGYVLCLALSQDGYLQSGSDDLTIVKQTILGEKVATFRYHTGQVLCLALSNDGYLQSGSSDKTIVKHTTQGDKVATFRHHSDSVQSLALSHDGYLQSGSFDQTIVKQTVSGDKVATFRYHSGIVCQLALSHDGYLYSGSYDQTIVKQTIQEEKIASQRHHIDKVQSLALSQDGYLYSSSSDKTIVKQKLNGERVATFRHHNYEVQCLALSNDGYLQSGSSDKTIVKQTVTGERVATFRHHADSVHCLVLSKDGYLQSGSSDKTIRKQTVSGEKVGTFRHHSGTVLSLALSQDGYLFSSGTDKTIVKQKVSGEKVATFFHHKDSVNCLQISKDGFLFSASTDKTIVKLTTNGNVLFVYSATSAVQSIADYDEQVVAALENGSISIFQIETGVLVKSIQSSQNLNICMKMINNYSSKIVQLGHGNGSVTSINLEN